MRKKKAILLGGCLAIIVAVVVFGLFLGVFKAKTAHLVIETNPTALVSIDNQQVGRTPFKKDLQAGEIVVKLVPQSDQPLVTYETKVILAKGIETVIHRDFGSTAQLSSGEVVTFEKVGEADGIISVISTPDTANVKLDGQSRGTTPLKISALSADVHQLAISANGYRERSFPVQVIKGYRLVAAVDLLVAAGDNNSNDSLQTFLPDATPSPTPTATPLGVVILNTPTGFLRVRSEPSVTASEVGRATPGKTYKYLDKDEKTGWLEIELKTNLTGWVSNEYASPSAKLNP